MQIFLSSLGHCSKVHNKYFQYHPIEKNALPLKLASSSTTCFDGLLHATRWFAIGFWYKLWSPWLSNSFGIFGYAFRFNLFIDVKSHVIYLEDSKYFKIIARKSFVYPVIFIWSEWQMAYSMGSIYNRLTYFIQSYDTCKIKHTHDLIS